MTPGQAKLAKLYWEVWTGEPTDPDCPSTPAATHIVDCEVKTRYGDDMTCDQLTEYTPGQCLPFPDSDPTDQWWIECEQDPNDSTKVPYQTLVSNALGKLHSMKLTCEDAVTEVLGKGARSAVKLGAADLGAAPASDPLGAAAPSPSPSGKNPHLVEYIVIPIVCAIVLAGILGLTYCACGKKSKKDAEAAKGPFQATPNPTSRAPIDEDDEKVHSFIESEDDKHHVVNVVKSPVVVSMGNDPVLAMGSDAAEQEKAKSSKKKSFFSKATFSKASFFGKKKSKTPESAELGEGGVGYSQKSGKISTEDPDEAAALKIEEPLTGSLKEADAPSDSKASDGPSWGDDKPLEVKTVADASDETAGYPVLDENKTAPSNNLF